MSNQRSADVTALEPLRPYRGGLTCATCQEDMAEFIEGILWNSRVADNHPILLHLLQCAYCTHHFLHLVELLTASDIAALQAAWIIPKEVPQRTDGLLQLWQQQLTFHQRFQDQQGVAISISIIGLIRRQEQDIAEAEAVHRFALDSGFSPPSLLSQCLSYTDLAYIALQRKQGETAVNHLQQALPCAVALRDQENEARIHFLFGQAWEQQERWAAARLAYEEAEKVGTAVGDSTLATRAFQMKQQLVEPVSTFIQRTMKAETKRILSLFDVTWQGDTPIRSEKALAQITMQLAPVLGEKTSWRGHLTRQWANGIAQMDVEIGLNKQDQPHFVSVGMTLSGSDKSPLANMLVDFGDIEGIILETSKTDASGRINFVSQEGERFFNQTASATEVGFYLELRQEVIVASWQIFLDAELVNDS